MALFRGIQEYIALDANNITLVFDSGNIVNISGNIFLYIEAIQYYIIILGLSKSLSMGMIGVMYKYTPFYIVFIFLLVLNNNETVIKAICLRFMAGEVYDNHGSYLFSTS